MYYYPTKNNKIVDLKVVNKNYYIHTTPDLAINLQC